MAASKRTGFFFFNYYYFIETLLFWPLLRRHGNPNGRAAGRENEATTSAFLQLFLDAAAGRHSSSLSVSTLALALALFCLLSLAMTR